MARYAAIDVGTNTVLLVVAERTSTGFSPVAERGEITRLGKGVDASRRLAPEAIERTLDAVGRYSAEARAAAAAAEAAGPSQPPLARPASAQDR